MTQANFAPGSLLSRLSASCWSSWRRSTCSSCTLANILAGFLAANAIFPFARGGFLDWHRGRRSWGPTWRSDASNHAVDLGQRRFFVGFPPIVAQIANKNSVSLLCRLFLAPNFTFCMESWDRVEKTSCTCDLVWPLKLPRFAHCRFHRASPLVRAGRRAATWIYGSGSY